MLDFSVTFNIIFTAVTGALGLFMLVSFIAVAAAGKRRCNAFDVILRILASLAFAAAAVLAAAVVLVWLDGEYKITVANDAATLVLGPRAFALPLPALFAALNTIMGACLIGAVFVLSLVALICDCTIANKKKKRELKVTNSVKTPEQRRIAAEVAKIRAIGNSAVRRTTAAAESADTPSPAAKASDDAQPTDVVADADSVHNDAPVVAPDAAEKREDVATPDWRTAENRHSDFVGLNGNTDPDFDTFDSFDEFVGAGDGAAPVETDIAEHSEITDDGYADDFGAKDESSGMFDKPIDDGISMPADDGFTDSESGANDGEGIVGEAANDEDGVPSDDAEAEQERLYADDDADTDDGELDADDDADVDDADDVQDDDADGETYDGAQEDDGDYAPNRNIYFPRVRTISRYAEEQSAAAKKPATGGSKPKAQSKTPTQSAKKSTAQKRRGNNGKPAAKSKAQSGGSDNSRKLPVNRRYVIIDRRSAVNMFGDYLRERDGESKDKLKSSISTIILK